MRYIVLAGSNYYPAVWDDFRGTAHTIKKAVNVAENYINNPTYWDHSFYYNIVDRVTLKVVASGMCDNGIWSRDSVAGCARCGGDVRVRTTKITRDGTIYLEDNTRCGSCGQLGCKRREVEDAKAPN